MATRVAKTGGSGSKEFAAASQPVKIAELDQDLDAIFGSIDNTNIANGASIATAKLAGDGGITAAMLASNAVTNTKIAAGATVTSVQIASVALATTIATSDTLLATLGPFTPRATKVLLLGQLVGFVTAKQTPASLTIEIRRDGVVISATQSRYKMAGLVDGNLQVSTFPLAFPIAFVDSPTNASHTYTIVATVNASGATTTTIVTDNQNAGTVFAVELA